MQNLPFALITSCAFASYSFAQSGLVEEFEAGTGLFFPFGGAQIGLGDTTPYNGEAYLAATNRTQPYEGPAIDLSSLVPSGAVADISVWVRMPVDATVKMTVKRTDSAGTDQYESVGQVGVTADEWTELSGTYSHDDATALVAYLESETLEDIDVDDFAITVSGGEPATEPQVTILSQADFDVDLGDWVARDAGGNPTLSISDQAFEGAGAAMVSDRAGQGDGIGLDVTELMPAAATYTVSAQVRMAEGSGPGEIWMSMRRSEGGADSYDTLVQLAGVTADTWTPVTFTYRMPARDTAFMYFETAYPDGTTDPFLVDSVVITTATDGAIEDLTPIQDAVPFPVGVAIDARETEGLAADLTALHFGQLTPENHMKTDAWYDDDRNYVIHPDASAIMDFAQENGMSVYGHTLLWHRQNPEWFFLNDDGVELTDSPEDQAFLRQRLRDHIFAIARLLSNKYGLFGSDTNPLTAFDVVNEVIADGAENADGLRRSKWFNILGPEYIDLAFEYAEEAFNQTYADASVDRPVMLAINDYNTEQAPKRARLKAHVQGMLDRGLPVDIVGNQFHINMTVPASVLDDAITDLSDLGLMQAVTELDIPTGTPVTDAVLIDQGYLFRDAFEVLRKHADDLYSVSVWGLTDDRSWLADRGDALIFDEAKQAKPAYFGVIGGDLPPRLRSALAFATEGAPDAIAADWQRLPILPINGETGFQTRWSESGLIVWVTASDPVADTTDRVLLQTEDATYTVARDGTGDIPAEVQEVDGGWIALATIPFDALSIADQVQLDVSVTDDEDTVSWSGEGGFGTLTLVEPLSFTQANATTVAPEIDGVIDDAWADAPAIKTDIAIQGDDSGATGIFSLLWNEDTLFVLATVTDDTPDTTASDPWQHDSIEVFLDLGNAKNGAYLEDDAQIRVSRDNVISFGAGNADQNRITSAVSESDGGYVVEIAIDMMGQAGAGTFHGLDVQVNDASNGARTAVRTWAEPTGTGYQTNARWGAVGLQAVE